jgi:hypothetical protein
MKKRFGLGLLGLCLAAGIAPLSPRVDAQPPLEAVDASVVLRAFAVNMSNLTAARRRHRPHHPMVDGGGT